MAYRRTANLPGTQQYGLRRRQHRSVEEYDWNPTLSRSERRLINPPLPPIPDTTHELAPPDPDPNAIDPSLAPDPDPIAPSPDPDATLESTPMTPGQEEAGRNLLGDIVSNAARGGFIGSLLGGPAGGLTGMTLAMLDPMQWQRRIRDFIAAQDPTSLAIQDITQRGNLQIAQEEAMTEPQNIAFGEETPEEEALSEPQNIAFGEEQTPEPDFDPNIGMAEDIDVGNDEGLDPGMTGPGGSLGPEGTPGMAGMDAGPGDGDGGTVLCTALYDMGGLDKKIYKAGSVYAGRHVDSQTYAGYFVWAKYLAKRKWIVLLLSPLINSFANEMSSRLCGGKGNFIGKVVMDLGSPVCKLIGKIMEIGNVRNYV